MNTQQTHAGLGPAAMAAMFLAFAFAYFLSTLLRAAPATLAGTLTQELRLSAGDLGLLSGAYFLGFSLTQLPLGKALDRFGPRRVLAALLVLATLACWWFARADDLRDLVLSRALIGVGVSACLMAPLTAFRTVMPIALQLRANAWMLMTGSLGMLASTLPLHWLLPRWGWRGIFDGIGVAIAVAILVLLWRVPSRDAMTRPAAPVDEPAAPVDGPAAPVDEPVAGTGGSSSSSREPAERTFGYMQIFMHPRFVSLLPVGFFIYGGMIAMQALWVGPWLTRVAGWTPDRAAAGLFFVNASMLVTFFAWGIVMPRLARAGVDAHALMRKGMILPLAILPVIVFLGADAGAGWWALWCMSCSFVTLSQPLLAQEFPANVAGRALSAYNLVLFVGIFVVQWSIGALVDAFSRDGVAPLPAFRGAVTALWCLSVGAYAWYVVRERRQARAMALAR